MSLPTASQIDATVPADNVQVDKSLVRRNFSSAKAEITALIQRVRLARRLADGVVSLTGF